MHDRIGHTDAGGRERVGDGMAYGVPLGDRQPAVDVDVQVGRQRAAIAADAYLVHRHHSRHGARDSRDLAGLVVDVSVDKLLQGGVCDFPGHADDEKRDDQRARRVHPSEARQEVRGCDRNRDRNGADRIPAPAS